MRPGDRLIVCFVSPLTVGQKFASWPLHLTIVPWFRLEESSEMIADGLARALHNIELFTVKGDGEAMFGPKKTRKVRLVVQTEPLNSIEAKVRNYFHKKRAWLVDETTKKHHDFRPHVTEQAGASLRKGEEFSCSILSIVEQLGNKKQIVREVRL